MLCGNIPPSILCKFTQKNWIKLLSLPLLEFYIREIFVILQSFDIVSENDFPLYKCLFKVTYYHAICIYPTLIFSNFFINYIFALHIN